MEVLKHADVPICMANIGYLDYRPIMLEFILHTKVWLHLLNTENPPAVYDRPWAQGNLGTWMEIIHWVLFWGHSVFRLLHKGLEGDLEERLSLRRLQLAESTESVQSFAGWGMLWAAQWRQWLDLMLCKEMLSAQYLCALVLELKIQCMRYEVYLKSLPCIGR